MHNRPKYLNLMQIRLPLPAFVSILHRASGALLFLALPLLLFWLHRSLNSAETFAALQSIFARVSTKLIVIVLLWGYLHHLCAGIRHLAMDMHFGLDLPTARASSVAVFAVSIPLTVVIAALLW
jgi:succinate dehydrogenase / fumarate reductase cytochrome b subunit